MSPYTVPTGTVDAFASTQQGRDIQEFLVQYVATFVPAASGENFNPHVTTGAGPQTYLDVGCQVKGTTSGLVLP